MVVVAVLRLQRLQIHIRGSKVATGADAGVASVVGTGDDAVYTYNYQGTPVDVTLDGLEANDFVRITEDGIGRYVGGTTYHYSRFGVVASVSSSPMSSSSIAPAEYAPGYENGEVFYVGQKTSSMPATGTEQHTAGMASTTLQGEDFHTMLPLTFSVNYGDRRILGYQWNTSSTEISMIFDEGIIDWK